MISVLFLKNEVHLNYHFSKDIIQRWAYPLTPDLNRSDSVSRHTLSRYNVYKQPDVTLAK